MSSSSSTQTVQQLKETVYATLRLNCAPLPNLSERVKGLVQKVVENDQFTPEQKNFAVHWEGAFNQLLRNPNPKAPVKALCFFGMKVITPALLCYSDNRLASERLIPLVTAHRELLAILLPANADVEKEVEHYEEVYALMLETNALLNDIQARNGQMEQLLIATATESRERIYNQAASACQRLRTLAVGWRESAAVVQTKLDALAQSAETLNHALQMHSQNLETIGRDLVAEEQLFQSQAADLIEILKKVF